MKRLTEVDKSGSWSIAGIKLGNVKGNLYGALCKLKAYEDTGLTPEEIIDGKLLTGWIEVEERLPDEPECGIVDMDSLKEYIVMIDHASLPTFLLYAGDGEWYRDGDFYKVLAWMPLPEPYKPQHLASADNDTAQSGLQSAT